MKENIMKKNSPKEQYHDISDEEFEENSSNHKNEINGKKSPDQNVKMTEWKNEPTLMELKQDFMAANNEQSSIRAKIEKWRTLKEGKLDKKVPANRSKINPKLIRRQAEWRYSALTEPFLSSNKLFKVKPVSWEDNRSAEQNELVINWQFRTKLNQIKFVDELVRSTVDEGTAIIRIGWELDTKIIIEQVPVYEYYAAESEEELQLLDQLAGLKTENFAEYEKTDDAMKASLEMTVEMGTPVIASPTEEMEEVEKEIILKNQPTVQILNPDNVYIDPSCEGDISKARFIIVSFETSKSELKKAGIYKNLDDIVYESEDAAISPFHTSNTPSSFQFEDEARKRIVAYEYWGLWDIDGNDDVRPIVATWVGNTCIRMEENPFPDERPPIVVVPYMPIVRSVHGEPDAELLEDNQAVLGAITRGMIDLLARSANGQTGIAKQMLDPINRKRFDMGLDYEFNPIQHPSNGIVEHKFPEINQSTLMMLQIQNQEAEALTGVKSFSGGISGNAYGEVAAGIRGMLDAASKREMAILRRVARGVQEVGYKIIMMNQVFLSEEEVIRVTNEEFVTVHRENLGGHFDLEVDIATAEVDNARSQDLAFMIQTIGPSLDLEMQKLLLSEIAPLKRMPTLAKQLREYAPQPDPIAEEIKQLEVEKLKTEIMELQSKIALNQAQAEKARAEADMNSLNFVEQETGTKHERDMQKQSAQAMANQDLEITKALTKPRKEGESQPAIGAAMGYNRLTEAMNNGGNRGNPDKPENFRGRGYARPPSEIQGRTFGNGTPENPTRNPNKNIGSKYFDPNQDPALNLALGL